MALHKSLALLSILAVVIVQLHAAPTPGDDDEDNNSLSSWASWARGHASTALDSARGHATTGWSLLKSGTKKGVTAARKGLENLEERLKNVEDK